MSRIYHPPHLREVDEIAPPFDSIYAIGTRGHRLKRAPALRDITAEIAERERLRLLGAGHACWYCQHTAPADSWLFACRMRERPVAMLVCPECLPRVRPWKPTIKTRLFSPLEVQP